MGKTIAKIKLAPGNVAWYDPLTSIYLTLTSQEAFVCDNDDLSNIKKGIRHNCILLKEGLIPPLGTTPTEEVAPLKTEEVVQPKARTIEVQAQTLSLDVEDIKVEEVQEIKVEDTKKSTKGKKKANVNQKKSEAVKEALEIQEDKSKKE